MEPEFEFNEKTKEASVTICYPKAKGSADTIFVGLCDVRAADSLRIRYDCERDGWSIAQASTFEWDSSDPNCGDMDYQEVAFIQVWA